MKRCSCNGKLTSNPALESGKDVQAVSPLQKAEKSLRFLIWRIRTVRG